MCLNTSRRQLGRRRHGSRGTTRFSASPTEINGETGDDTFCINGPKTAGPVTFDGGRDDNDTLRFDPQKYGTNPEQGGPVSNPEEPQEIHLTDESGEQFGPTHSFEKVETLIIVTRPVPTIISPQPIHEGDDLTLSVSAVIRSGDTVTFDWDLDGDGVFGDILPPASWQRGSAPLVQTVTWAELEAMGIRDNDQYLIAVRAADLDDEDVGTDANSVIVTNVAPTVAIVGAPAVAPEGMPISLDGTVSDPGADEMKEYNWSVTRDGGHYASGYVYLVFSDKQGKVVEHPISDVVTRSEENPDILVVPTSWR